MGNLAHDSWAAAEISFRQEIARNNLSKKLRHKEIMNMDAIIACLAGFAVVCALVNWWKNRGKLAHCMVEMGQEHESWNFKDWADPLTSIAAGLSLLLTIT